MMTVFISVSVVLVIVFAVIFVWVCVTEPADPVYDHGDDCECRICQRPGGAS
jgi:hypothetical protein